MYNSFCYQAFTHGIMKDVLDATSWGEMAIMIHQAKIESEDNLIRIIDAEDESKSR